MQIRPATLDDLPGVAEVILASLSEDSSWKSLFAPGFRNDPAYDSYAREVLTRYLDPENEDRLVLVAEVSKQTPKGRLSTIVSVAIWDMSQSQLHDTWRKSIDTLCDIDDIIPVMEPAASNNVRDKLVTLHTAVSFSQRQHFEHVGPYAYLEALATHPAHRGQGYAKALCAVGIESARGRRLAVAVLTSSRGYIFFSGLAFADLGCVSLRGPDRSREDCMLKVMVLRAPAARPKTRRRGSVINSILSYVSSPRGS